MWARRNALWLCVAVSGLLHVLLSLGIRAESAPSLASPLEPATIAFDVIDHKSDAPLPAKQVQPLTAATRQAPVAALELPKRPARAVRNTPPSAASFELGPPATATTQPSPTEQAVELPSSASKGDDTGAIALPPSAAAPVVRDLSPLATARTLQPELEANRHNACTTRTPSDDRSCDQANIEADAQAHLNQELMAGARSRPLLAQREPPKLHPAADGSYQYRGPVIAARVERDGQVSFQDPASLSSNPIPLGGGFDLTDAIERHVLKREVYSAEKQWFLSQTVALREQLANAYRAQESARSRRMIEQELERIAAETHSSVAQKHAAMFALWEDCGEDAEAERTRRIVEVFVRTHMPEGSALGFSASELEGLNHSRTGLIRFEPYRS
jgi:hypothetical protein